jgi:hypothetical protein
MSKLSEWIADQLFEAGRGLVDRLGAFGRTRTKKQQREELEEWNRTHVPLTDGKCAVCGKPNALDTEHCGGPTKPWKG